MHSDTEFASGEQHTNDTESFWSFAKRCLAKFNGVLDIPSICTWKKPNIVLIIVIVVIISIIRFLNCYAQTRFDFPSFLLIEIFVMDCGIWMYCYAWWMCTGYLTAWKVTGRIWKKVSAALISTYQKNIWQNIPKNLNIDSTLVRILNRCFLS